VATDGNGDVKGVIEISPLFALYAEEIAAKMPEELKKMMNDE